MIKEFEFYHGVVLARLVHEGVEVRVKAYKENSNASYILNGSVGLYIKYSKKRITPWRFSFQKRHQDEIQSMRDQLESVFLILVCGDDGIAVISYDELKKVLDETHNETEWIAVSRRTREKYKVTGSDGRLKYKIGENEFPSKVIKSLI